MPEELQAAVIPEQPLPQQPILQQETAVVGDQQSAVIQEQQVLQEQPVIQEQQVIQQPNYDADEYNMETEEITRGKKLEKSKNLQWQRNRMNTSKFYRAAFENHDQFEDHPSDRILNDSHSINSILLDGCLSDARFSLVMNVDPTFQIVETKVKDMRQTNVYEINPKTATKRKFEHYSYQEERRSKGICNNKPKLTCWQVITVQS